jgi:hypothetical protein
MNENQQGRPAEPGIEALLDLLDISKMSETSGFHTPTLDGALDAERQRLILKRGTVVFLIDLRSDIEALTRYLMDHAGVEPLPDPHDFVFPAPMPVLAMSVHARARAIRWQQVSAGWASHGLFLLSDPDLGAILAELSEMYGGEFATEEMSDQIQCNIWTAGAIPSEYHWQGCQCAICRH